MSARNQTAWVVMMAMLAVLTTAWDADAALIRYYVSDSGVGAAEAEMWTYNFYRVSPDTRWEDHDAPLVGTFSGASGGRYIRALPDVNAAAGTPSGVPYVEYLFFVPSTALGNYRVYLRATGTNTGSDSLYLQVRTITDTLLMSQGGSGVLIGAGGVWDAGGWDTHAATPATISSAGWYKVRIGMREDGAAVDKLVFQLDTLSAPTGLGPAVTLIPEPSSVTALLGLAVMLRGRPRRRDFPG